MTTTNAATTARHLLRSLLRSASYLPDSLARSYIKTYILQRFRDTAASASCLPERSPIRLKNALRNARQGLHTLERANNGELKPLTKVLLLAYGRAGRRRRDLMAELLRANSPPSAHPPSSAAAVSSTSPASILSPSTSTSQLLTTSSSPPPSPPFPNPPTALQALLTSHHSSGPASSPRGKLKSAHPLIPAENIWGRPMPLKRVKNIRKKWWAETLDKLLPPLPGGPCPRGPSPRAPTPGGPGGEWDRLRDLASGAMPCSGRVGVERAPKRRRKAASVVGAEGEEEAGVLDLAMETKLLKLPVRHALRQASSSKDSSPKTRERHHLTPRFMRRLYGLVWHLSPKMDFDAARGEGREWRVEWGGGRSAASRGVVSEADLGRGEGELFVGMMHLEAGDTIP